MTDLPVLVPPEDGEYLRSRIDHAARILLLQRPKQSPPSYPMALLAPRARPYLDDSFWIIGIDRAYEINTVPLPGRSPSALSVPAGRLADPDPEESTRRFDFGMIHRFRPVVRGITAIGGFEFPFIDLNDDPWLEWVHPGEDHSDALRSFRQYYATPPTPRQLVQTYWASPNWVLEAERDFRVHDHGGDLVQMLRQIPYAGPFPAVRLDLFQIEPTLGSITLSWSQSFLQALFGPGIVAAGYRLYTNGVPAVGYMPATQQQVTITNLVLGQSYLYGIVAVNYKGVDASSLSNVIAYEHGTSEVAAVYSLSSDNPGGEL